MHGYSEFEMFHDFPLFGFSPQAVENVGNVMSNLLKVQNRMNTLTEKLADIKTTESEQTLYTLMMNSFWITINPF